MSEEQSNIHINPADLDLALITERYDLVVATYKQRHSDMEKTVKDWKENRISAEEFTEYMVDLAVSQTIVNTVGDLLEKAGEAQHKGDESNVQ